jgi:hypothetical protein
MQTEKRAVIDAVLFMFKDGSATQHPDDRRKAANMHTWDTE